MINKLKKQILSNIFTFDLLCNIKYRKHNKKLTDFQEKCSEMDIFSTDEIIDTNKYLASYRKEGVLRLVFSHVSGESLHYGHLKSILDYGNIQKKDAMYFPSIEHGCLIEYLPYQCIQGSVAIMGPYRRELFHKTYPDLPVFTLGPLIHYASPYYDEDAYFKRKQQWGKTLLIFPTHTTENAYQVTYNMHEYGNHIMQTIAPQFDTVAACLYWKDFDTNLYDILRAQGIEIVSAGYRWDNNFIRRLKTILSLADAVVGNSNNGTHIGYCAYLNKPFQYIETNAQYRYQETPPDLSQTFAAYHSFRSAISKDLDIQGQRELCEPFWGLNEIKSPEEIKAILEINKKILRMCYGNSRRHNAAARKLLQDSLSGSKHKLLAEAMGLSGSQNFNLPPYINN